ncbi:class I SAM-dependent methyltransferase [Nocardiopsis sp. MG754419]|uniref:class I SAM-dependent methyltransferase n=1 Tax=Nocardiopsis sp. MG754419 TaxID=2259865 RepID=UPI001BAD228C|nr:class I SAM-dependent methyltransferase [Nocardiopsis sp. MG754419]
MSVGLEQVRRDWTRLGSTEPLWAVCVDPDKRDGGWDDEEFLASGRAEVGPTLARLDELVPTARRDRVLDFGCGAGRLSNALADHFDRVVGVDISAPMLAEARRLDRSGGRIEFVLNERPDLSLFEDDSFDVVYTDLVLQHLPTDLAEGYVREFARVVRPGGALVLGVPETERRTFKGLVFRYVPWPLVALAQRVVLSYPAPMRMHTLRTARLAALLPEATIVASDAYWGGDHWRHLRHYVRIGGGA